MNFRKALIALATIALLLPVSVFAKEKNEGKFQVSQPVQVGSSQLKPGEYKVQWDGTGPDVQLTILQNGKTVATAPAKLVESQQPSQHDSVILRDGTGNVKRLDEINFAKQKRTLVLSEAQPSSGQ